MGASSILQPLKSPFRFHTLPFCLSCYWDVPCAFSFLPLHLISSSHFSLLAISWYPSWWSFFSNKLYLNCCISATVVWKFKMFKWYVLNSLSQSILLIYTLNFCILNGTFHGDFGGERRWKRRQVNTIKELETVCKQQSQNKKKRAYCFHPQTASTARCPQKGKTWPLTQSGRGDPPPSCPREQERSRAFPWE